MSTISELTILAMLVMVPSGVFQKNRRPRLQRNRAPIVQAFVSSNSVIALCPFAQAQPCSPSTRVTLEVKASDPDNDDLNYKYSVTGGTVTGSGSAVNWDLTKTFGNQTATVEVTDPRGGKALGIARVNVVECTQCDPPCTHLSVTCPSYVTQGETAVFSAAISGDVPSQGLTYLWSHSHGKRRAGQEGPTLGIEATGPPGDTITATVRVLGLDPACNHQASCETRITKRVPGY